MGASDKFGRYLRSRFLIPIGPFKRRPALVVAHHAALGMPVLLWVSNDHQCRASTLSGRRECVGPSQSWVTSTFPSCARPSCAGRPVSATDLDMAERSVLLRHNIACLANSRLAGECAGQLERARTAVSDWRRSPTALAEADRIVTDAVVCRLIALDLPYTRGLPWQPRQIEHRHYLCTGNRHCLTT